MVLIVFVVGNGFASCADLSNGRLSLGLDCSPQNVSGVKVASWLPEGQLVFRGAADSTGKVAWLAKVLPTGGRVDAGPWTFESNAVFERASSCLRYDGLLVTRHVELAKQGTTFRTYISLANTGKKEVRFERFPIWKDRWDLGSEEPSLDWWDSLTFKPHQMQLQPGQRVGLSSKTYSSQQDGGKGNVPFWHLRAARRHLFFSLAWCGGWRAEIERNPKGTGFEIVLPPQETQLTLKPGEEIRGPMVYVTIIEADSDTEARAQWLVQRQSLNAKLYGGPKPWFPLVYNHWYAVGTKFDFPFLEGQLDELERWRVFDVFVLDHGWFEKVGDWRPAAAKFRPGQLESFYGRLRKTGIKAGIWSCPWLQAVDGGRFGPEIDEPRFHRDFMDAYSLDLTGIDFDRRLVEHIAGLKDRFGIDWWKYDQELFGESSRQGKMKKTAALENALTAVRCAYPELNIENCMSGGRMIDALTDGISQSHWIRDGGHSGEAHARSNIKEALGAAGFLPLAKIQRWINRPDQMDPADEEMLKFYCRSAMIGVWGISGDMTKIMPEQRRVILNEVKQYRHLNEYKASEHYRILYPGMHKSKLAGIVLYDLPKRRAAILVFRWQGQEAIKERISLDALPKEGRYNVTDADSGETRGFAAEELTESGMPVSLEPKRRSGIYWIE